MFDLEVKDLQGKDAETRTSPFESRFPINIGITGHVATTGEVWRRDLSVPDSYTRTIPNTKELGAFDYNGDLT